MRIHNGKRIVVAAGVAAAVSVTGLTGVHAQQSTSDADIVAAAQAAVVANGSVFGFGADQALTPNGVFTDQAGSAVRFNRTYKGLPVLGGDMVVHITADGAFRYGNGAAVAAMPATIAPDIAQSTAIVDAAQSVPYPVATSSANLVVFASDAAAPLAWKVSTESEGGRYADATFISATTGETLASWTTIQEDGTGKTLYSGKVDLKTVKSGSKWLLQDETRGTQKIYDAHSQEITAGVLMEDRNNVWGNFTTDRRKTAGADAAYALSETWDYYLETYGRDGIGDDGVAARGFVHVYSSWVNASWSDACFCMRFGDGSLAQGITPLVALDVGGHEMTHGVTSRTAGLVYANESGGLNESTSDVLGTSVEWFANNANDVPDYVIGEQIFTDYDPATNYIRRMDQPSVDGRSKDCWYNGVGGLDPHYSSGIGNHFFYLLSEGSGAKTINGIKYNSSTCDGSKLTGIGQTKAAAIWYKALSEQWTANETYHQARDGMLKATADLYGSGSAEYKAVNATWAAVSVTP